MKSPVFSLIGLVVSLAAATAQTPAVPGNWLAAARGYEYGNSTAAFGAVDLVLRGNPGQRATVVRELNALLADGGATAAARQLTTRRLAWVGDAESVAALGKAAGGSEVGFFAIRALGMNGASTEALVALLAGKDTARAAAGALGTLRSEGGVEALAKASRDSVLAPVCWAALAEIGTPSALKALLATKSPSLDWTRSFLAAAERQERLDGATVAELEKLVRPAEPGTESLAAARLLLASGGPGVVAKFAPGLASGTPAFRRGLAVALGQFATASELSGIEWPPDLAPFALRAATARRDPALLAFFQKFTGEDFVPAAALGQARVGGDDVVLPLVAGLGNAGRREATVAALRVAVAPGLDAALKGILAGESDSATKAAALGVLAERRSDGVFEVALGLLESPDAPIRKAAADALAQSAGPGDLAPLLARFGPEAKPAVRMALRRPLARAAALDKDPAAASRILADSLATLPPAGRDDIFAILADLDTEAGRSALGGFLASDDPEVRKQAIRALAASRNRSSYLLLRPAAEKATESSERVLALRGWIDAIGANSALRPKEAVLDYRAAEALASRPEERDAIIAAVKRLRGSEAQAFLVELTAPSDAVPAPPAKSS